MYVYTVYICIYRYILSCILCIHTCMRTYLTTIIQQGVEAVQASSFVHPLARGSLRVRGRSQRPSRHTGRCLRVCSHLKRHRCFGFFAALFAHCRSRIERIGIRSCPQYYFVLLLFWNPSGAIARAHTNICLRKPVIFMHAQHMLGCYLMSSGFRQRL